MKNILYFLLLGYIIKFEVHASYEPKLQDLENEKLLHVPIITTDEDSTTTYNEKNSIFALTRKITGLPGKLIAKNKQSNDDAFEEFPGDDFIQESSKNLTPELASTEVETKLETHERSVEQQPSPRHKVKKSSSKRHPLLPPSEQEKTLSPFRNKSYHHGSLLTLPSLIPSYDAISPRKNQSNSLTELLVSQSPLHNSALDKNHELYAKFASLKLKKQYNLTGFTRRFGKNCYFLSYKFIF